MSTATGGRYMSVNEFTQLRDSAHLAGERDMAHRRVRGVLAWMVVDLATGTGLRVGEIAGLQVGDIDFRRKLLCVRRLKRRPLTHEYMPISPELTNHLFDFVKWKYRRKEDIVPEAALFCGKRGPMTTRGLQRIWHRARERAGLPKVFSIRSARHTVAIQELKRTGDIRRVQRRLGHASPGTTANMYLSLSRQTEKAQEPVPVG